MVKKADIISYLEDNGVALEFYDGLKYGDLQKVYKKVQKIKKAYKKILDWENVSAEINKILKKNIDVDALGSRLTNRMEQFPDQYEVGSK